MIDQNLIDQNITKLIDAVTHSKSVTEQLKLVENAFDQSMLSKLQEYFNANYSSNLWGPETTAYGIPMDNIPRVKLAWDPESVIEELHEVCRALTPNVLEMYPDAQRKFDGIVIWRDHPGYNLAWHTDNPVIEVSLQIYLSGSSRNPGTEFKTENSSLIVPFVPNTGYIVNHSGNKRPMHRIAHPVPEGEIRYSLFALWKHIL
jgi:hypothetical protein